MPLTHDRAKGVARCIVLALAAFASLASVMSTQPAPQGYSDDRQPDVRLITREMAEREGLVGEPFAISFGEGQNGTELAFRYLRAAGLRGAGWVSDLQVVLRADTDRARVCVTSLLPIPHTRTVSRQEMVQPPPRSEMVMRPVTRTVTEYQYRCRMVSKPRTHTVTRYESRYDFGCKCMRAACPRLSARGRSGIDDRAVAYSSPRTPRRSSSDRVSTRRFSQVRVYSPSAWRARVTTEVRQPFSKGETRRPTETREVKSRLPPASHRAR
jgi:hypothetical protein